MIEHEFRSVTLTPAQLEAFAEYNNRWQNDSLDAHISPIDHPDFRRIVAMGQPAVPVILEELRAKPSLLFAALEQITGENPVKEKGHDNVEDITQVWVEWGEKKRYIQPMQRVA